MKRRRRKNNYKARKKDPKKRCSRKRERESVCKWKVLAVKKNRLCVVLIYEYFEEKKID